MSVFLEPTDDQPMAKKKSPPPKRPGRPKTPEGPKLGRYAMRASKAWMAWLARYAGSKRKDMAVVVRESLKASADADGFDKPPNE